LAHKWNIDGDIREIDVVKANVTFLQEIIREPIERLKRFLPLRIWLDEPGRTV
jgi:hypothetical protein